MPPAPTRPSLVLALLAALVVLFASLPAFALTDAQDVVVRPARLLEQEDRSIEASDALESMLGGSPLEGLPLGLELARVATAWQEQTLGLAAAPGPSFDSTGSPSTELRAVALATGADPFRVQSANLAALDALPGPQAYALSGLLAAFLDYAAAAQEAYALAPGDPARLEARLVQVKTGVSNGESWTHPERTSAGLPNAEPDLARVFASRGTLLEAAQALQAVVAAAPAAATSVCAPIQVAPAFSIDLATCDETYTEDFALVIDAGGNDVYVNNAGGGSAAPHCTVLGAPPMLAAALIDYAGDDRYGDPPHFGPFGYPDNLRACGANGGGFLAAGLLVDAAGNDQYYGGFLGANGGGAGGLGLVGLNAVGTGLLLDAAGNDFFQAFEYATNGGGKLKGAGMLLNVGGSDTYTAGWRDQNGFESGSSGTNGGGENGVGFLLDTEGDDHYTAGWWGTNGGGDIGGVGFLMDGDGNDVYEAQGGGVNGGAVSEGVGFLRDVHGDDRYVADDELQYVNPGHGGSNGGGNNLGVGYLLDEAGNDAYEASGRGVNGGGVGAGSGHLLDLEGDDEYVADVGGVNGGAATGETCPLVVCVSGEPAATGLLYDAGGHDIYSDNEGGAGVDRTVAPKGVAGAQIDRSG